jgi:hypothetical protein
MIRIGSYLKSVLRYKFFILDTYHPDILCLREQGCEDPWLFCENKEGLRAKKVWVTLLYMKVCP